MKLRVLSIPAVRTNLCVLHYEPKRPRGVTLVAAHGYSSSKQNLDFLCNFLAAHGCTIYSLDFPGHKLGCSGGQLESDDDLLESMAAVVHHARLHTNDALYTMGHSMGAMTALRTAAADEKIAGCISIATGFGRPTALEALAGKNADFRSAYVDGLTLPELVFGLNERLDAELPGLAGRPVLYIAASKDMMVSPKSVRELYERAPEPKSFATIESDHTYAADGARSAVLAWINERHSR